MAYIAKGKKHSQNRYKKSLFLSLKTIKLNFYFTLDKFVNLL